MLKAFIVVINHKYQSYIQTQSHTYLKLNDIVIHRKFIKHRPDIIGMFMMAWFSDNQCISINVKEILTASSLEEWHQIQILFHMSYFTASVEWDIRHEVKQWWELKFYFAYMSSI